MNRINISVGSDLTIDTNDDNVIKILRSNDSNNAFELKPDGIYMNDAIIAQGDGVIDQSSVGLRVGWVSGYDKHETPSQPGRIAVNNIVHRVFTSTYTDGIPTNDMIQDFRSVDCFIPGDMIRIPTIDGFQFSYYLITETSVGTDANGKTNNRIEHMELLGTW